jgi:PAS domain S-box-containing protein
MTEKIFAERVATPSRAADVLEELLAFERLLSDLSARFANVSGDQVDAEIERALKRLLNFLGFDRSNFGEYTVDGWINICSVAANGVEPHPLGRAPVFLGWYLDQIRAGKTILVRSLDDLPSEAIGEAEYFRRSGIRASLGIPLRVAGRIVGLINFAAFRSAREWPEELIARLKVVGEVMAQALARKRSDAALRMSEERWRSIFETSNLGISIIDRDLHYITPNPAFQVMLGYTGEEMRQLTPMDVSTEEDRETTRTRIAELQQGKVDHYEVVKQHLRKDGSVMWGHSYVSVVRDAESRPKMFIGTTIDITESKRAQDALRATQSELDRVTRLTAVAQMAASIAHEINQPLAAIVSCGSASLRWLAKTPPDLDEVRSMLKRIVSDGHRASEVVSSIRGMFKNGSQEKVFLEINPLIREVLALLHGELQNQRVSVQTELAKKLPKVLANRVQLQQVVLNLLMNALEAMVSVTDRTRVLRVKSEMRGPPDVVITVQDSGLGIDQQNVDRIFHPFFTTKPKGTGMGLSICQSIIEAHNGRLWASPGVDHGSVFQVVLPLASA